MPNAFEQLADEIEEAAHDLPETVGDAVERELRDVQREADTRVPEASGSLRRSSRIVRESEGSIENVRLVYGRAGEAVAPAALVEYGTGSRGIPIPELGQADSPSGVSSGFLMSLQSWIDAKNIVGAVYSERVSDTPSSASWSPLAEAIAWSIVDMGTNPHPFLRPAWHGHRRPLLSRVRDAIDDEMSEIERQF